MYLTRLKKLQILLSYQSSKSILYILLYLLTFIFILYPRFSGVTLLLITSAWYIVQRRYLARGPMYPGTQLLLNKTVIVTGANTGIGFEVATELARRQAHVILGCRSKTRGQDALMKIRREVPSSKVTLLELDISSKASMDAFAERVKELKVGIDILVNNAGVGYMPYGTLSEGLTQPVEQTIGTNFLGPVYLTHLLLPGIKSARGRIVTVGSNAMIAFTPEGDVHDIEPYASVSASKYNNIHAYGISKLGNALHMQWLHQNHPTVTSVVVHPGMVMTEITRHVMSDSVKNVLDVVVNPLYLHDTKEGSQTILMCCLDSNIVGGAYYADCKLFEGHHPMLVPGGGKGKNNAHAEKWMAWANKVLRI